MNCPYNYPRINTVAIIWKKIVISNFVPSNFRKVKSTGFRKVKPSVFRKVKPTGREEENLNNNQGNFEMRIKSVIFASTKRYAYDTNDIQKFHKETCYVVQSKRITCIGADL